MCAADGSWHVSPAENLTPPRRQHRARLDDIKDHWPIMAA